MSALLMVVWTCVSICLNLPQLALSFYCMNWIQGSPSMHFVGDSSCLNLTGYSSPQWATCLSKEYIEQVSRSTWYVHTCTNSAPYCWYQCVLEKNNRETGTVQGSCRCSMPNATPPPKLDAPALPRECYSPDGTDCSWYQDCLHTTYPCTDEETGHALKYAEHFCSMYEDNAGVFSEQARTWINSARKCLQVSLVPFLRKYEYDTKCSDIKKTALESHSKCYLNSPTQAHSLCNLSWDDWMVVFWTTVDYAMKGAAPGGLTALLETAKGCASSSNLTSTQNESSKIESPIPSITRRLIVKEQPELYQLLRTTNSQDAFSSLLADAIAEELEWNAEVIGWFGHVPDVIMITGDLDLVVDLFVADLGKLGLKEEMELSLDGVSAALLNLVEQGIELNYKDPGGKIYTAVVDELWECSDFVCSASSVLARRDDRVESKPPAYSWSSSNAEIRSRRWSVAVVVLACFVSMAFGKIAP